MSRSADVTLAWADGEYKFRLAIGQLRELQEKCSAGPQTILTRLATGAWMLDDVREAIRLGLIGGGLKPAEALTLVQRYVDDRPLAENVATAQAVVLVAVFGAPDEPLPGKAAAAKAEATESSPSPPSTGSALRSASRRAKSTN